MKNLSFYCTENVLNIWVLFYNSFVLYSGVFPMATLYSVLCAVFILVSATCVAAYINPKSRLYLMDSLVVSLKILKQVLLRVVFRILLTGLVLILISMVVIHINRYANSNVPLELAFAISIVYMLILNLVLFFILVLPKIMIRLFNFVLLKIYDKISIIQNRPYPYRVRAILSFYKRQKLLNVDVNCFAELIGGVSCLQCYPYFHIGFILACVKFCNGIPLLFYAALISVFTLLAFHPKFTCKFKKPMDRSPLKS